MLSQQEFWDANGLTGNRILTGPMRDGVVFKSGGTTGHPEVLGLLQRRVAGVLNEAFGGGIAAGIVAPGDRVVNLFYVGELYGSFLFINKSFELARAKATCFPMTGGSSGALIAHTVEEFKINTLAGVPTTLLAFAQHVLTAKLVLPSVKRVLFGGESMYPDQREIVHEAFPGVRICSSATPAWTRGSWVSPTNPAARRSIAYLSVRRSSSSLTRRPVS